MSVAVGVIGLGNWGTALGNHLALEGHQVLGWARAEDIVEGINASQRNPRYQSDIKLSKNFTATSDFDQLLELPVLVVVLPSSCLNELLPLLQLDSNTIVVSAVKGIEATSLMTPLQFLQSNLKPCPKLAVLSGPSFARDVVAQKPLGIVSASYCAKTATQVAELFSSSNMRVYLSDDPIGVEIGSVVKNTIALAAGVSDGLELGDSARAGLITRGLAEMMRLASAMGADAKTLAGLSGLGDLLMTATCDTSRNRTVGLRLGRGEELSDITETLGSVAEAVRSTPLVVKLADKYQVDMPITLQVARLLEGETDLEPLKQGLLTRPMKPEFCSEIRFGSKS